MSGDDEHVSECSHAEVIRREPGGRWLCRYCQEPFVQSFKLDAVTKERDEHGRALGDLSQAMNSPALHWGGSESMSDALVTFVLMRLSRLTEERDEALETIRILRETADELGGTVGWMGGEGPKP